MTNDHNTIETLIYLAGIGTASSIDYNQDTENANANAVGISGMPIKWLSTFSDHLNTCKTAIMRKH